MPAVISVVESAVEYGALGWRVVQILAGQKCPRGIGWHTTAAVDEAEIRRRWESHPDDGVGVVLGPTSGIIDLECDSPEAEAALCELWGGDPPVTATFAASRGKHRIFRWRDDLPHNTKAVFKWGALEVRTGAGGKGAQSVFPPSVHPSGAVYRWLVHPDDAGIAEIPADVLRRLHGRAPRIGSNGAALPSGNGNGLASERRQGSLLDSGAHREWDGLLSGGAAEGDRNSAAAALSGRLLADLRDPWDDGQAGRAWEMLRLWNARNSPPLGEGELRVTFLSILRRERTNFAVARSPVAVSAGDELAAVGMADPAVPRYPSAELIDASLGVGASPPGALMPPGVDGSGGLPEASGVDSDAIADASGDSASVAASVAPAPRTKADRAARALRAVSGGWKIEILAGKPVRFRVFSPLWAAKTPDGFIEVSGSELRNASAMGVAAAVQARVWLPKYFSKLWDGDAENESVAGYLLAIAEEVRPSLEHHRDLVVAELVLSWISVRKCLDEGAVPNSQSRCSLMADGRTVLRGMVLVNDLNQRLAGDRVTSVEVADVLRRAGFRIERHRAWGGGGQPRWYVGRESNVDRIRAAVEGNDARLLENPGAAPDEMDDGEE